MLLTTHITLTTITPVPGGSNALSDLGSLLHIHVLEDIIKFKKIKKERKGRLEKKVNQKLRMNKEAL